MRPVGIVLAIVSATLILSFPENAFRYAELNRNLPTLVLLVGYALMPSAAGVAILEGLAQEHDAVRETKAAESSGELATQTAAAISKIAAVLEASKAAGAAAAAPFTADRDLEAWLQGQIDQRFQELAQKAAELSRIADALVGKTAKPSPATGGAPPASP